MLVARKLAFILLSLALCTLLASACASPPWVGMSESEIAAWKGAGFGPDDGQKWFDAGFTAAEAKAWEDNGFKFEAASEWHKQKFTATEAASWKGAGMSSEEAVENREQGLMPIPPGGEAAKPEAGEADK